MLNIMLSAFISEGQNELMRKQLSYNEREWIPTSMDYLTFFMQVFQSKEQVLQNKPQA